MILNESTKTRDGKIYSRVSESLPELVGIRSQEIGERSKEIYPAEAIRYVGSQSDAIYTSAHFPKVFPMRVGVRITALIMILASLAVPRIGPPKRHESSDVDLRTEELVCAQDCMAPGGLKA